jgi:hypothetical protein
MYELNRHERPMRGCKIVRTFETPRMPIGSSEPVEHDLVQVFGGSLVSRTLALLELSPAAYEELQTKLRAAGYDYIIEVDGTIDMNGIGIKRVATTDTAAQPMPTFSEASEALRKELKTLVEGPAPGSEGSEGPGE